MTRAERQLGRIDRAIEQLLATRERIMQQERLRVVQEYIRGRLRDPFTVKDLAAHVGVSVRTLHHTIQTLLGIPPKQLITRMRLQAARERLEHPSSTDSVETIARRFLFNNTGRFIGAYRREFNGESPGYTLEGARLRAC
jgi:transcriptional regulator GlxA family with amidase domain